MTAGETFALPRPIPRVWQKRAQVFYVGKASMKTSISPRRGGTKEIIPSADRVRYGFPEFGCFSRKAFKNFFGQFPRIISYNIEVFNFVFIIGVSS